jgi:hypothetical protein
MIDLVLAVAVFSDLSPVPSAGPLPPPPLAPPVESVFLVASSSPSPVPVVTPTPSPSPQAQQQEPPKESWADKMWKRYMQNKGGN